MNPLLFLAGWAYLMFSMCFALSLAGKGEAQYRCHQVTDDPIPREYRVHEEAKG